MPDLKEMKAILPNFSDSDTLAQFVIFERQVALIKAANWHQANCLLVHSIYLAGYGCKYVSSSGSAAGCRYVSVVSSGGWR